MSSASNKSRNGSHKKKNNKRFGSAIPNQLYAVTFPREQKVSLRYHENRSFTTTASVANDYLYNLNSIFDPNHTGTGHQPLGYDQWASFYNRYRVDAVKVHWEISYTSADSIIGTLIANNSTTAFSDPFAPSESPMSMTKSFAKQGTSTKFTKNIDLAKLNGVNRKVYNADDRYAAPFGSDPTEKLMLHLVVTDPAGNAVVVQWFVIIEYECTMFDPIQQTVS